MQADPHLDTQVGLALGAAAALDAARVEAVHLVLPPAARGQHLLDYEHLCAPGKRTAVQLYCNLHIQIRNYTPIKYAVAYFGHTGSPGRF